MVETIIRVYLNVLRCAVIKNFRLSELTIVCFDISSRYMFTQLTRVFLLFSTCMYLAIK